MEVRSKGYGKERQTVGVGVVIEGKVE